MVASPYATPQTAMAASPYAMGGAFGLGKVPPGADYPPVDVKPTNFALIVGLAAGGIVLMVLAFVMMFQVLKRPEGGSLTMVYVLLGAGVICSIIGSIMQLIVLYRGWACLQHSNPRTTPGNAVGFLFIPLFNIYWMFVAYCGLAKDWNRIMSQHPNLVRMPRIGEGLAITWFVLNFAPLPVSLIGGLVQPDSVILGLLPFVFMLANFIILFILLSQICRGINSMAFRPTHAPGTFFIR